MPATYSGNPADSERDWVRFKINDTDTANALYTDAEIDAVISDLTAQGNTDPARKWWAAVELLTQLASRYALLGGGIEEKEVDELRLRFGFGSGSNVSELLMAQIRSMRGTAARLQAKPRYRFRAVV